MKLAKEGVRKIAVHYRTRRKEAETTLSQLKDAMIGRMPFVRAITGTDTLLLNFDTGATEWMTVPLAWRDSLGWEAEPSGGPTVSNNQTGATPVLVARLKAPLRLGDVIIERPRVYLNPDADGAWLGSGLLQHFTLTFDTRRGRVKLAPASGKTLKAP